MLELIEKVDEGTAYECVISLDYDSRKRGRLKVVTDSGESAGIFLQRGLVLHDGDCLRSKDGRTVIFVQPLNRSSRLQRMIHLYSQRLVITLGIVTLSSRLLNQVCAFSQIMY